MHVETTAYAKINLALHVTGQTTTGYHTLDTLVVFTQFGDRIILNRGTDDDTPVTLQTCGPFAGQLGPDKDNLVMRAALALAEQAGRNATPIRLTLEKNLPVASGMGGGSADAAAILRALQQLWLPDTKIELAGISNKLGADVAMCLQSTPLRAQSIGDIVTPLEASKPLALLLVNPGVPVATGEVFKQLAEKSNPPISKDRLTAMPDISKIQGMRNDLEAPAIQIAPVIGEVIAVIGKQTGCEFARMSGSGATCFGIFETMAQAQAAKAAIHASHVDWWCIASLTTLA